MKNISDPKANIRKLSLKETHDQLSLIYGGSVTTDFDKLCVEKYEINFDNGIPKSVSVIYNKLKVIHGNDQAAYWPIISHHEEMNVDSAKQLIEGLK